jgi:hypothetical protein
VERLLAVFFPEENKMNRHILNTKVMCFLLIALFTAGPAMAHSEDLDVLRAATEKYKDVNVALAEGFIPDPSGHCIFAEAEGLPAEWGAMGIHYINPKMLQISAAEPRVNGNSTHTDFTRPAILLYEPQADGSLVLMGIENLVWIEAWKAAGNMDNPVFQGRKWDMMIDDPATDGDEAHGFMPHYDQHVWLYRENTTGILNPFNPAATCEHHRE